jgi:hypothetical protein
MKTSALDWTLEPQLLKELTDLAQKRGQSLDVLLTDAIVIGLNAQKTQGMQGK